jgi:glycosyltransferase involved in cell wall biosynthesis
MKILWFCNITFSEKEPLASGTWLYTMANALIASKKVQLFNISQSVVKKIIRQDCNTITQWLLPFEHLNKNGLPSSKTLREIEKIVNDINPDIIHIWGTESYWGLLTARGYIKGNVIIEMQGLKFAIANSFYAGLSISEIINCIGFNEIIKPSLSLIGLRRTFRTWGNFEKEMLIKHSNISTQSDWVRAQVKEINYQARIYNTHISLRTEFINADKWELDFCIPFQLFFSSAYILTFKGLHVLIEAIAILKKRYPNIRLNIAGHVTKGFRQDGYTSWLMRKIKFLNLDQHINWLGSLKANELVKQIQLAHVVVIPSFIESYCLTYDEALMVGAPTVVSFAGALPEFGIHLKTTIFFTPGDIQSCAAAIEKIFDNPEFAKKISSNVLKAKKAKVDFKIADNQLSIYESVLKEKYSDCLKIE